MAALKENYTLIHKVNNIPYIRHMFQKSTHAAHEQSFHFDANELMPGRRSSCDTFDIHNGWSFFVVDEELSLFRMWKRSGVECEL